MIASRGIPHKPCTCSSSQFHRRSPMTGSYASDLHFPGRAQGIRNWAETVRMKVAGVPGWTHFAVVVHRFRHRACPQLGERAVWRRVQDCQVLRRCDHENQMCHAPRILKGTAHCQLPYNGWKVTLEIALDIACALREKRTGRVKKWGRLVEPTGMH